MIIIRDSDMRRTESTRRTRGGRKDRQWPIALYERRRPDASRRCYLVRGRPCFQRAQHARPAPDTRFERGPRRPRWLRAADRRSGTRRTPRPGGDESG